jgi:hypothetical protein
LDPQNITYGFGYGFSSVLAILIVARLLHWSLRRGDIVDVGDVVDVNIIHNIRG